MPLGERVVEREAEGHREAHDALFLLVRLTKALRDTEPQLVAVGEGQARGVSVLEREEVRQVEGVDDNVED